jgi:CRP-like cAMP-binding protein
MRLRRDAKVDGLSGVPLFAHCSKKELRQIATIADELDLPVGRVLCREGHLGRQFFLILDGTVEVTRGGRKVASIGAGEVVGEASLVSRLPRNATVTVTEPARALVVTSRDFTQLLEVSPMIQGKVARALADRVAPQTI